MADNVTFQRQKLATPPADTIVATDEIGGVQYQRVNIFGKTGDTTFQSPRIDPITHAIKTIDYEHSEIHGGRAFNYESFVDLSVSNVLDLQITTPDTNRWAHLIFSFDTESETEWRMHRNVSIVTAGAAVEVINADHNSTVTSGLVIKKLVTTSLALASLSTVPTGGVTIGNGIVGAGKDSGHSNHDHERILKQNEDYTIRFIANTAGYVNWDLRWYEHINRSA